MRAFPTAIVILLASLLLLTSCAQRNDFEPSPPSPLTVADDELNELGTLLQSEFRDGEYDLLDSLFSPLALFQRIIWPHQASPDEVENYLREHWPGAPGSGRVGERLVGKLLGGGNEVHYVGVRHDKHSGAALVFRFTTPTNGFAYIEFLMTERDKEVVISDFYASTLGGYFSSTMRTTALNNPRDPLHGLLRLNDLTKEQEMAVTLVRMRRMIDRGKSDEALVLFQGLSADLTTEKLLHLAHIEAASKIGKTEYARAIETMHSQFPDDPGAQLWMYDLHLSAKRWDDALNVIENLDERYDDPYLDFHRGIISIKRGRPDKAEKYAIALMRYDSLSTLEPYLLRMEIGLAMKEYAAVASALDRMQANGIGEIQFDAIEAEPTYADFILSPEYRELKRTHSSP